LLLRISILTALLSMTAFADTDVPQAGPNPIVFDQTAQTDNLIVLTAGAADHNSGMAAGDYGSVKYMWVSNFNDNVNDYFKWNVSLATGGDYHVWAMLSSGTAVPLKLSVDGQTAALNFTTRNIGWDKLDAGVINIPAGTHILTLVRNSAVSSNIDIKSLELIRESDRAAYETRITNFKRYPSWFSNAKYGLFLQYGPWGYPATGNKKSFQDFANGFDVNKFVTLVQATGASYVIWSLTWYSYQIIAPIRAVDSISGPGYTSSRDVLGEIATALHNKGIRLFFYYIHYMPGQSFPPNFHSTGTGDRSTYFNNFTAVVGEIGTRYGSNLDGWFFDDACDIYPGPFERLGAAARMGNPNRMLSWNAWVAARYTDFQDVTMGEGSHGDEQLGNSPLGGNGVFTDGPQKGLIGHGMFILGNDWGIHTANQAIPTQVSLNQLQGWVKNASAHGRPLSLNFAMWEDETTSPATTSLLAGLKNAVVGIHQNSGNSVVPTGGFAIHSIPGGLEVSFPKVGRYRAELTAVNGKAVTLCEGSGEKAFIETRRLAKGVYTLRLQCASGAQTGRIVVP
jgi:hypothetical protein